MNILSESLRFHTPIFIGCAAALLVFTGTLARAQDGLSSWTSSSGTTIQAEFVGFNGKTLVLRTGAKYVNIPADKLAPASQLQASALAEKTNLPVNGDVHGKAGRIVQIGADFMVVEGKASEFPWGDDPAELPKDANILTGKIYQSPGGALMVSIGPETMFKASSVLFKVRKPLKLSDFKIGDRVRVLYKRGGKENFATRVAMEKE